MKMIGYKEREVKAGKKGMVYFNLHKKCFSMKQGGLVVLHADEIALTGATFHVSEAGRQKVLREKRKNVHAHVKGDYIATDLLKDLAHFKKDMREAYYNPYQTETFVDKETGEPISSAVMVILSGKQIFYKKTH